MLRGAPDPPLGPLATRRWKQGSAKRRLGYRRALSSAAERTSLERYKGPLAGGDGRIVISLRVTMIFRPEDGTWKVVRRYADPITTARPPSTTIES